MAPETRWSSAFVGAWATAYTLPAALVCRPSRSAVRAGRIMRIPGVAAYLAGATYTFSLSTVVRALPGCCFPFFLSFSLYWWTDLIVTSPFSAYTGLRSTGVPAASASAAAGSSSFTYVSSRAASATTMLLSSVLKRPDVIRSVRQAGERTIFLCSSAESRAASSLAPLRVSGQLCALPSGLTSSSVPQWFSS